MSEDASALAAQHGGVWGSHSTFPVSMWREEVENDYTRASYWDWVLSQIEQFSAD